MQLLTTSSVDWVMNYGKETDELLYNPVRCEEGLKVWKNLNQVEHLLQHTTLTNWSFKQASSWLWMLTDDDGWVCVCVRTSTGRTATTTWRRSWWRNSMIWSAGRWNRWVFLLFIIRTPCLVLNTPQISQGADSKLFFFFFNNVIWGGVFSF